MLNTRYDIACFAVVFTAHTWPLENLRDEYVLPVFLGVRKFDARSRTKNRAMISGVIFRSNLIMVFDRKKSRTLGSAPWPYMKAPFDCSGETPAL